MATEILYMQLYRFESRPRNAILYRIQYNSDLIGDTNAVRRKCQSAKPIERSRAKRREMFYTMARVLEHGVGIMAE